MGNAVRLSAKDNIPDFEVKLKVEVEELDASRGWLSG